MPPNNYHQLLTNQVNEIIGNSEQLPPNFKLLLQRISDTYNDFDTNQKVLDYKVSLRTNQLIASTSNAYSFFDALNMGFILCDVTTEVVVTNSSIKKLLSNQAAKNSISPTQLTDNQSWTIDFIDNLLQPDVQLKKNIRRCLATNQSIESKEVSYGQKILHLLVAPMITKTTDDGQEQQIGAIILVDDVTEQTLLERSKDEFLSIASHELRTPLTVIRGNAFLIKKYYADNLQNKDMIEMIDDIHASSVRLIDIVNDFLDVSAIEQGKIIMNPTNFLPAKIIDSVSHELQSLCDTNGLKLIIDTSVTNAPEVLADEQRIKQVIYNLVGNAIKFTDKGSITISTRSDDDYVYTIVTDTGMGISSKNQSLLFRKFQQAGSSILTRDNTKGTGLGLYISKLIIGLSGGTIKLESSELGKGSSFMFSLPRAY